MLPMSHTSQIRLRQATHADNATLASIIRQAFEEHDAPRQGTVYSDPSTDHLYELFQAPQAILWVAEWQGVTVGCCGIYPTPGLAPDTAELAKFYILKEARSKGIGKALMQQCITSAQQLGYSKLYLESLPHYEKAVGMYMRAGFKPLSAPLGESGHTSCNIWMLKEL